MSQLRMYINQRLFEAGLYLEDIRKGDFPPKGWTSLVIRVSLLFTVVFGVGAFTG